MRWNGSKGGGSSRDIPPAAAAPATFPSPPAAASGVHWHKSHVQVGECVSLFPVAAFSLGFLVQTMQVQTLQVHSSSAASLLKHGMHLHMVQVHCSPCGPPVSPGTPSPPEVL